MEEQLVGFTHQVGLIVEAMAVLVIAYGSVEAFIAVIRTLFSRNWDPSKRNLYVRYLRWLVAGLTFQLAADIVHTAIAPTWTEIGHVGAIAVIRTFLGYFLNRDMREAEPTA